MKSAVGSLDSREIYAGPEFKHWVEEEELIAPEQFLLERYLRSDQSTLEAGTGGGRILRALARRGFKELSGFDKVLCFITDAEGRRDAVAEAYRILKPDGLAVFSFLCYESRLESALYRALIGYLRCLRTLSRQRRSAQYMPWLWIGNRVNISAILDRPPHVYWYRFQDAVNLLLHQHFKIVGIGTRTETDQRKLCKLGEEFKRSPKTGMLYIVCQK